MRVRGIVFEIDKTKKGRTILFVADEDGRGAIVKVVCAEDPVGVKKGDIVEVVGAGFGVVNMFGRVWKEGKNG